MDSLATFSGGKTPSTGNAEYWGGEVLWVTSKDMKSYDIYNTQIKLSKEGVSQMQIFPPLTILIVVRSGILRRTLPIAVLRKEATINQDLKAISLFISNLAEFFFFSLMAVEEKILTDYSKAGTTVESINFDELKKILIPIPPLQEQLKIVVSIKQCFELIDGIEQSQESLQFAVTQAKSKILDLAIRGKLVPQDPNDEPASILLERIKAEHPESKKKAKNISDNSHYTFCLPKSWEWTTIGEISQHNTGKTLDKGRNSGVLHKYITTSNLYWNSFVLDNLKEMPFEENEVEKCSAIKGDLLICEGGDGGRSAIWNKEYPIYFQNHIHRVRPFSSIRSKYIYFFMLYSSLNGYINYYKKGIGIQGLSGNSLSAIKLPLPPISEQRRIVKRIEEIFVSLDEIANSIRA